MSEPVQADFYDLPSVYDILHLPGTAAELDGLERMALRYVRTSARAQSWLEPCCGTARFVRLAARRGTRITGVDLSRPMLDYARARLDALGPVVARRADLVEGDITRIDQLTGAGRYDFAFCLINSLRHLPGDAAMRAHLAAMRNALKPGGVYAVGLNFGGVVNGYPLEFPSEDVWRASRGRVRVRQVVQYDTPQDPGPGARTENVYSVVTVRRGGRAPETYESFYRLRTYTRSQWSALCSRSGFESVATVDENGREVSVGDAGYGIHILMRQR